MPPRVTACPWGERVGRGHGPWPSGAPDGSASHGERPPASCSFRLRESAPCAGPAQGRGEMQSVPRKQATSRHCPRETVGPPPCQPVLAAPCPRAHQAGCHAHAAVPQERQLGGFLPVIPAACHFLVVSFDLMFFDQKWSLQLSCLFVCVWTRCVVLYCPGWRSYQRWVGGRDS